MKLEYPSRREASTGSIKIGKILDKTKKKYDYYLRLEDLERHMFIVGVTGSGKSNFLQHFLVEYKKKYQIPILLVEFKGEYHFLQKKVDDLLIYRVGDNFAINIFDPEGSNVEVHAERIFQIFRSGGLFEGIEYSPQMERVFVDILNRVCRDVEKRNWKAFYNESKKYLNYMLKETKDITFKNSIQAVTNRIRRYSLGTLRHTFEKKYGLNVKDIFKHNILLDLSHMIKIGGEKEDTLFFLNVIMKYLWDKNLEKGSRNYKGIRHITIIEDAQYFASHDVTERSTVSSYIEDIALLLRGTGECLITLATRPAVSAEILANVGIFVCFQNHLQKDLLEDLLNLDKLQRQYLSMLPTGNCIIRVNSIGKPFLLSTPLIERTWLNETEIKQNNLKVLERFQLQKNINLRENVNKNLIFKNFKANSFVVDKEDKKELKYNSDKKLLFNSKNPSKKKNSEENCSIELEFGEDLNELEEMINELLKEEKIPGVENLLNKKDQKSKKKKKKSKISRRL